MNNYCKSLSKRLWLTSSLVFLFIGIADAQNISYRNLFDDTKVYTVYITLPADSLAWLYKNVNYDNNINANFVFDDGTRRDTMRNVGFRLRGNTSRTAKKKSFKVKFNAYTKGIKYQGVKELNLNSGHNDPTLVREKLFYDIWNRFGLPERRANFVKVYLNNAYYGLYTNIEEIDDDMMKRVFGKDKDTGNLYKCTYPADLKYIDDNQTTYKNLKNSTATGGRTYDLKTNETLDDYSGLVNLIKTLNQTPTANLETEVPKVLNMTNFIKAYVVEVACGHWDDHAYNKNNFFLYHHPNGYFEFISYDPDNCMGVDWVSKDWGTRNIYTWHLAANSPPMERLIKVKYFRNLFSIYHKSLLDNVLQNINGRIDSLRTLVSDAAKEDTYRTQDYSFTHNDFYNNFDFTPIKQAKYGIKQFFQVRKTNTLAQLEVINSVNEKTLEGITIYPNPAHNQVFIDIENGDMGTVKIELLDRMGIPVKMAFQELAGKNKVRIDLDTEGVTAGIYFLRVVSKERISVSKILIVK
jgi:hypothetical protein